MAGNHMLRESDESSICDPPTLKVFNNWFRSDISYRWFDLGVQFLNVGRLQTIKNDHNNDDQRCSAMFQKWIEKDTSASWKHLIKALRNIDMNQVAENISNAFYDNSTANSSTTTTITTDNESQNRSTTRLGEVNENDTEKDTEIQQLKADNDKKDIRIQQLQAENDELRKSTTKISVGSQTKNVPDPSKCEKTIPPTLTVNKEATLKITLRDSDNNFVIGKTYKITVTVLFDETMESAFVKPVKEVGGGRYEVPFTASRCGYYMISIIVDGHHIPGSPYKRTPVDYRDYKKMTEQDCSQVVTDYGEKKFDGLYDIAIAPTGEIVIVDSHSCRVIVLDDRLNLLRTITKENSKLVTPDGVAVTDNVIAITDCGFDTDRVIKFSLQGEFLTVIGRHGGKNGQFNKPRGLAFNKNKLLYVVDRNNYRVQVFNQDDTFAFSFGSEGEDPGHFQKPVNIAIDRNSNVLVTDCSANRIDIFTHGGQFIQRINTNKPSAITISPTGYLITGHHGDVKIRVWSPTYQLINQFGKDGAKQGEFRGIAGMAMDSSGTIYVVECANKRLQVICNRF